MTTQHLHTYCAMCVSRCGVVATVEDGRFTKVNADPAHPNGCICVKGTAAPEIVYSPDRLQYPMRRTRPKGEADPGWVRISWDEALTLAASRLLDIKARYGPEAVVFGRATPGASASADFEPWLSRLLHAFGSPNLMSSFHLCNWHQVTGSQYTYGVGMPSPDYEHTRCVLLWGYNPEASSPTAALRISRARARGARLIVIDPRPTNLAQKADCWLQVRPGSDGALALSMLHVLLEEALYDAPFVRAWTNGPFLVRTDTQHLLTARDLASAGDPATCIVWDSRTAGLVGYHPETGYQQDGVEPALAGTFACTLTDGSVVACRPAFQLLTALAAQYAPEQSEALTSGSPPALCARPSACSPRRHPPATIAGWDSKSTPTPCRSTGRCVAFMLSRGNSISAGAMCSPRALPRSPLWDGNCFPKRKYRDGSAMPSAPLGHRSTRAMCKPTTCITPS